uniref:Uncharacterized protein n=1 Tax=Anguilla anguilla TaxID=7936 RepID=A0A0E9WP84_ANGAN
MGRIHIAVLTSSENSRLIPATTPIITKKVVGIFFLHFKYLEDTPIQNLHSLHCSLFFTYNPFIQLDIKVKYFTQGYNDSALPGNQAYNH